MSRAADLVARRGKSHRVRAAAGGWRFQRAARGGLHPSAAGDAWIAAKVAATLRAHGVAPAAAGRGAVICDSGAAGRRSPRFQ